jgi:hypothetical protein
MEKSIKESCPENEEFVRFFLNKKLTRNGETLIDHIRNCGICRLKYKTLWDMDSALRKDEDRLSPLAQASFREIRAGMRTSPRTGRAAWTRRFAALGAFAGLLLVVFLVLGKSGLEDTLRGSSRTPFSLMIPQGPVSDAPRLFFWAHVPKGEVYRFELIDDELQTLIALTTPDAWVLIPESIQKQIRSRRIYLWTVEAVSDDNLKIGESRGYFELK